MHAAFWVVASDPSSDASWLVVLGVLGVVLGVYLFFQGFRMLRYKRLILNTPFSKIRSASMGLVEVSGMPTGPKTINSAITGSPCYYYRARAWQWVVSEKGGGSWKQAVDESICVPFFLDDSTGKVLVNAQGATMDVHRSFYDEVYTMSALGQNSLVPESIRKFVAIRGLVAGEKVRLEEHIIKPGFPLFVFGTLGENRFLSPWTAQPHVGGKKVSFSLSFGNSPWLSFSIGADASGGVAKMLGNMLENTSGSNTRTYTYASSDGGELPPSVVATLKQTGVNLPFPLQPPSAKATLLGGARSVVVQTVAPPQLQNDAASSDAVAIAEDQNHPAQSDAVNDVLHASAAISKGERGEPFTISSQSQREVVQSLGWRAVGYIWGGPVFALICFYFLMVYWGLM